MEREGEGEEREAMLPCHHPMFSIPGGHMRSLSDLTHSPLPPSTPAKHCHVTGGSDFIC